jgi:hypothetical protein
MSIQVLQQTGHAIDGSSSFSDFSRVSRLLSLVLGGDSRDTGKQPRCETVFLNPPLTMGHAVGTLLCNAK